jgi:hypothetical protein
MGTIILCSDDEDDAESESLDCFRSLEHSGHWDEVYWT